MFWMRDCYIESSQYGIHTVSCPYLALTGWIICAYSTEYLLRKRGEEQSRPSEHNIKKTSKLVLCSQLLPDSSLLVHFILIINHQTMQLSSVFSLTFSFLVVVSNALPASYSSSMSDPLLSSLGLGSMGMGMGGMNGMYGGIPPPMPPPGMSPYGMGGYGMMGPMGGMGGMGPYGSGMSPYGMGGMGGYGSQMSFPYVGKKK
ncbi:unnamed protein product [Caenorhabditis brenneri]